MVMGGELSIGTLIAIQAYIAMLFAPIMELTALFVHLNISLVSARRIFDVLDFKPEVRDGHLESTGDNVSFENVWFRYEHGKPVLKNFNLKLSPGKIIGLVGKSGSGKTTTANLLVRLVDPQKGDIKLDETDIRNLKLSSLRHAKGFVQQEPVLFKMSVAENIAYAEVGATMKEIEEAARMAGVHDFIKTLPDGYGTNVGEKGELLSVGQRQRIQIARALLKKPRILIFDEATASIDAESETQILNVLKRLATEGKTVLLIAHRLSTMRIADRLAILENGRIIETGTFKGLSAKRGAFQRLCGTQFKR